MEWCRRPCLNLEERSHLIILGRRGEGQIEADRHDPWDERGSSLVGCFPHTVWDWVRMHYRGLMLQPQLGGLAGAMAAHLHGECGQERRRRRLRGVIIREEGADLASGEVVWGGLRKHLASHSSSAEAVLLRTMSPDHLLVTRMWLLG